LKPQLFGDNALDNNVQQNIDNSNTLSFVEALGGRDNIVETNACITRLRMTLKDSSQIDNTAFTALGASGVIKPDNKSIQIVLGTKAEKIAQEIRDYLDKNTQAL